MEDNLKEYKKIKESSDSIMEVFYNVEVYGNYNIPYDYPAILVGNCRTYSDIFTILYSTIRQVHFLSNQVLPEPLGLPVKEQIECKKQILYLMRDNELLNIFLEEKKICQYKDGVFALARETGIPIIPYGIKGTYKLGNKITIRFGEAMCFKNISKEIMEQTIEYKVKKLSE